MDLAALDLLIASPRKGWSAQAEIGSDGHGAFCDAFARRVAEEYWAGRLSFNDADGAMTELYSYSYFDENGDMPPFAWEVFEAFDEGEYYHHGDSRDWDPEDVYTKPMIRKALGLDVVV
jgi:hypothetical protein